MPEEVRRAAVVFLAAVGLSKRSQGRVPWVRRVSHDVKSEGQVCVARGWKMRMLDLGIEFSSAAFRTAGRSSGSVMRNLVWVTRKWWESSRGVYAGLDDALIPPRPMIARPRRG